MQIRFKQLLLWCVAGQLLPLSASFAQSPTTIFSPVSTPASSIFGLSLFVLAVAAVIFAVVFSLLVYSIVRFRNAGRTTTAANRHRFMAAIRWNLPGR